MHRMKVAFGATLFLGLLRMGVFGDLEPKLPQHYRRHDWIGSAIRKKMATLALMAQD